MASARRTLLVAAGLAGGVEPAPVVAWDWRECACGVVFFGPEGRDRCLVCRTGFVVVRVGAGRAEDDEEASEDMARALGIDRAAVEDAARLGTPPEVVCVRFGVTAAQFAAWLKNHRIEYPGCPSSGSAGVRGLQDEIDRLLSKSPDPSPQTPRIAAGFARSGAFPGVRGSKEASGLSTVEIAANVGNSAEGGEGVAGRAVAEPVLAAEAAGAAPAEGVMPGVEVAEVPAAEVARETVHDEGVMPSGSGAEPGADSAHREACGGDPATGEPSPVPAPMMPAETGGGATEEATEGVMPSAGGAGTPRAPDAAPMNPPQGGGAALHPTTLKVRGMTEEAARAVVEGAEPSRPPLPIRRRGEGEEPIHHHVLANRERPRGPHRVTVWVTDRAGVVRPIDHLCETAAAYEAALVYADLFGFRMSAGPWEGEGA